MRCNATLPHITARSRKFIQDDLLVREHSAAEIPRPTPSPCSSTAHPLAQNYIIKFKKINQTYSTLKFLTKLTYRQVQNEVQCST